MADQGGPEQCKGLHSFTGCYSQFKMAYIYKPSALEKKKYMVTFMCLLFLCQPACIC